MMCVSMLKDLNPEKNVLHSHLKPAMKNVKKLPFEIPRETEKGVTYFLENFKNGLFNISINNGEWINWNSFETWKSIKNNKGDNVESFKEFLKYKEITEEQIQQLEDYQKINTAQSAENIKSQLKLPEGCTATVNTACVYNFDNKDEVNFEIRSQITVKGEIENKTVSKVIPGIICLTKKLNEETIEIGNSNDLLEDLIERKEVSDNFEKLVERIEIEEFKEVKQRIAIDTSSKAFTNSLNEVLIGIHEEAAEQKNKQVQGQIYPAKGENCLKTIPVENPQKINLSNFIRDCITRPSVRVKINDKDIKEYQNIKEEQFIELQKKYINYAEKEPKIDIQTIKIKEEKKLFYWLLECGLTVDQCIWFGQGSIFSPMTDVMLLAFAAQGLKGANINSNIETVNFKIINKELHFVSESSELEVVYFNEEGRSQIKKIPGSLTVHGVVTKEGYKIEKVHTSNTLLARMCTERGTILEITPEMIKEAENEEQRKTPIEKFEYTKDKLIKFYIEPLKELSKIKLLAEQIKLTNDFNDINQLISLRAAIEQIIFYVNDNEKLKLQSAINCLNTFANILLHESNLCNQFGCDENQLKKLSEYAWLLKYPQKAEINTINENVFLFNTPEQNKLLKETIQKSHANTKESSNIEQELSKMLEIATETQKSLEVKIKSLFYSIINDDKAKSSNIEFNNVKFKISTALVKNTDLSLEDLLFIKKYILQHKSPDKFPKFYTMFDQIISAIQQLPKGKIKNFYNKDSQKKCFREISPSEFAKMGTEEDALDVLSKNAEYEKMKEGEQKKNLRIHCIYKTQRHAILKQHVNSLAIQELITKEKYTDEIDYNGTDRNPSVTIKKKEKEKKYNLRNILIKFDNNDISNEAEANALMEFIFGDGLLTGITDLKQKEKQRQINIDYALKHMLKHMLLSTNQVLKDQAVKAIISSPYAFAEVKKNEAMMKQLVEASPKQAALNYYGFVRYVLSKDQQARENPLVIALNPYRLTPDARKEILDQYPNDLEVLRYFSLPDNKKTLPEQTKKLKRRNVVMSDISSNNLLNELANLESLQITDLKKVYTFGDIFFGNRLLNDLDGIDRLEQQERNFRYALTTYPLDKLKKGYDNNAEASKKFIEKTFLYNRLADPKTTVAEIEDLWNKHKEYQVCLSLDKTLFTKLMKANPNLGLFFMENDTARKQVGIEKINIIFPDYQNNINYCVQNKQFNSDLLLKTPSEVLENFGIKDFDNTSLAIYMKAVINGDIKSTPPKLPMNYPKELAKEIVNVVNSPDKNQNLFSALSNEPAVSLLAFEILLNQYYLEEKNSEQALQNLVDFVCICKSPIAAKKLLETSWSIRTFTRHPSTELKTKQFVQILNAHPTSEIIDLMTHKHPITGYSHISAKYSKFKDYASELENVTSLAVLQALQTARGDKVKDSVAEVSKKIIEAIPVAVDEISSESLTDFINACRVNIHRAAHGGDKLKFQGKEIDVFFIKNTIIPKVQWSKDLFSKANISSLLFLALHQLIPVETLDELLRRDDAIKQQIQLNYPLSKKQESELAEFWIVQDQEAPKNLIVGTPFSSAAKQAQLRINVYEKNGVDRPIKKDENKQKIKIGGDSLSIPIWQKEKPKMEKNQSTIEVDENSIEIKKDEEKQEKIEVLSHELSHQLNLDGNVGTQTQRVELEHLKIKLDENQKVTLVSKNDKILNTKGSDSEEDEFNISSEDIKEQVEFNFIKFRENPAEFSSKILINALKNEKNEENKIKWLNDNTFRDGLFKNPKIDALAEVVTIINILVERNKSITLLNEEQIKQVFNNCSEGESEIFIDLCQNPFLQKCVKENFFILKSFEPDLLNKQNQTSAEESWVKLLEKIRLELSEEQETSKKIDMSDMKIKQTTGAINVVGELNINQEINKALIDNIN